MKPVVVSRARRLSRHLAIAFVTSAAVLLPHAAPAAPHPAAATADKAAPAVQGEAINVPGAGGVRVNGEYAPARAIWDEYYAQIALKNFIHAGGPVKIDAALVALVVGQIVNRMLVDQEAARRGYVLTPEDEAAIRSQEQARWGGEENYRNALRMLTVTEEHQLVKARSAALRRKLIDGDAGATCAPDPETVRRYYDEHPDQFIATGKPPLRYLCVARVPGDYPLEKYGQILKEAEVLRKQGKSYADLVARHSTHPGAAGGGIVDESAAEKLPFQPKALKTCRSSEYACDDSGLHVYLRDCSLPMPFEEAREKVRERVVRQHEDDFLKALVERLRAAARIEYEPLKGEIPPPVTAGPGHEGR